jgi:transcriptional regulator with XRE-family HTH domain
MSASILIRGCGSILKQYRERANITQLRMADYLGINENEVSRYERNIYGIEYARILKYAQACKVSVRKLLDECLDTITSGRII